MQFYCQQPLSKEEIEDAMLLLDFYIGQPVEKNAYFGFRQLTEVAMKALSPGINDPGTAVISLHALSDLFLYKMTNSFQTIFYDKNGAPRASTVDHSFEHLFTECFYPVWDYGKKDRYVQNAMLTMMTQLDSADTSRSHAGLITSFILVIRKQMQMNTL